MQTKFFKLLGAIMLVAFMSGFVSGAMAVGQPNMTHQNGKVDVVTDQATISVTGGSNVPFYNIKLKNDNTSYEVKFAGFQEFTDKNGDGLFQNNEAVPGPQVVFPALGWDFSNFANTTNSNNEVTNVDFNFTHTSTGTNDPSISLNNHIDVSSGNQIKFDIIMNQYSWVSTNNSAMLAIKLQVAGGNLASDSSTSVSFGDASFSTVSTASSPSGDINVKTQVDGTNTLYLIVDHFNGNFTLDPLFSATSGSGSNTSSNDSNTAPGFETIAVLGGLAIFGLVYKKKQY